MQPSPIFFLVLSKYFSKKLIIFINKYYFNIFKQQLTLPNIILEFIPSDLFVWEGRCKS
jgi:hypothetical protein